MRIRMAERRDKRKRRRCIVKCEKTSTFCPNSELSAVGVNQSVATVKRLPFGVRKKTNLAVNVYVTRKTPFKAQLVKCERILDTGASEVIIHGLGAAINRACNVALQLKEIHRGVIDLDIRTSTANLIDDLEPANDEVDYETRIRNNSSIHIRVFRKIAISTIKYEQ